LLDSLLQEVLIMEKCVILVHGGAWSIPDKIKERSLSGVEAAARVGWSVLLEGGTAVDAVEAAVIALEDNPVFDAGRGSVLTEEGEVEMDAFIMDGQAMRSGAVGAVATSKNPVKLARHIMEKTEHTLIVGQKADALAAKAGFDIVGQDYLVTPEGREEWETYKKYSQAVSSLFSERKKTAAPDAPEINSPSEGGLGHDTVGCVALDAEGNLAAATSTGGITGKMPGRVGDTPLAGAGGYADNQVGSVSTTGHGESITKVCLAHTAINFLESGETASSAGKLALKKMFDKVGGAGGLIIIDKSGDCSVEFTTSRMAWAGITSSGTLKSGIEPDQVITKKM